MNSYQILCFQEIVKVMNFTKAAQAMYISQPAISKQIMSLEEELGYALFDRSRKTLRLTYAGELFWKFVCDCNEKLKENQDKVRHYERQVDQRGNIVVNVGIFPSTKIATRLADIFSGIMNQYDNLTINVYACKFRELPLMLDEGRLDLIVSVKDFIPKMKNVKMYDLPDIPKMISYRYDLFKPTEQPKGPYDFRNVPFLVADDNESPYIIPNVIRYCREYGFTPIIKAVPNSESMVLGVQNGDGVIIKDPWINWLEPSCIGQIQMYPSHHAYIIKRDDNSNPYVEDIVRELCSTLKKTGYFT